MSTPRVQNLADGYDLDSLTFPGEYSVVSPDNSPDTGNFYVFVWHANIDGQSRTMQVAHAAQTGTGYVRCVGPSGWTSWVGLSGSSIPESTGGGTAALSSVDVEAVALAAAVTGFGKQRLQTALGAQWWNAAVVRRSGGTFPTQIGGSGWSGSGNGAIVAPNPSAGTILGGYAHNTIYTGTGVNNSATLHNTDLWLNRGGGVKSGGFVIDMVFGFEATYTPDSDCVMFFGLNSNRFNAAVSAGGVPDTATDIFGIGKKAGATAFSLFHNDASGNATEVDLSSELGASQFAANALYHVLIVAAPGDTGININVRRLDTGDEYVARATTDIPANTTALTPDMGINTKSSGRAQGFTFLAASQAVPFAHAGDFA
ncbi:MAG: pyocin knob domain-containing protein [Octadecabacter sp.]|nr:pyocin knob domain-containing protein [Octadecabacter sp.]